jgi:hypothetical protein
MVAFSDRPPSQQESKILAQKLLRMIVALRLPFSIVDNKEFRDCTMRPAYSLPSKCLRPYLHLLLTPEQEVWSQVACSYIYLFRFICGYPASRGRQPPP